MNFTSSKQTPYFEQIRDRIKTIEGRLARGKWLQMKVGDYIDVHRSSFDEKVTVRIEKIALYPSFKDMIEAEGVEKVIPHVHTVTEAVQAYRGFYSKEEEGESGVLALHIVVI
jgi:ASC-1-like (ASCH) protein